MATASDKLEAFDPKEFADTVCGILDTSYGRDGRSIRAAAKKEGITTEQVVAVLIGRALDEAMRPSVVGLARTATFLHQLLLRVVQDAAEGRDVGPVLARELDRIEVSEAVLQAWRDRLGLEVEDMLDQADEGE